MKQQIALKAVSNGLPKMIATLKLRKAYQRTQSIREGFMFFGILISSLIVSIL